MKKSYNVLLAGLAAVSIIGLAACGQSKSTSESKDKKIDFILDWSPNLTIPAFMWLRKRATSRKQAWMWISSCRLKIAVRI